MNAPAIAPCPLCGGQAGQSEILHGCRACHIWMEADQWASLPRRVDDAEALLDAYVRAEKRSAEVFARGGFMAANESTVSLERDVAHARAAVLSAMVGAPPELIASAQRVVDTWLDPMRDLADPMNDLRAALAKVRKS